jgi:hypothetical protein
LWTGPTDIDDFGMACFTNTGGSGPVLVDSASLHTDFFKFDVTGNTLTNVVN